MKTSQKPFILSNIRAAPQNQTAEPDLEGGMRILLVDDDDDVRDLFREYLSVPGHEVFSAGSGVAALELLQSREIDVVLVDIVMPGKDGVSTIYEIRKMRPNMNIIAISGGGRAGNLAPLRVAAVAGADLLLTKPINRNALISAVQAVAAGQPNRSKFNSGSGK
jgi:CheY-like chemotaxis protein